jgi:predicted nucleic acid-binding protein
MQNSYVHFQLLPNDADDNKFVDCAIASNAELIVTNDKDFNPLKTIPWPKVEIMNIQDFVRLITQ